jgi:alkyldihydroxyacetonephosphate synthase
VSAPSTGTPATDGAPPGGAGLCPKPRSFWGWGDEGGGLDADQRDALKAVMAARLGLGSFADLAPPRIEDVRLPAPRIAPPASLAAIVSQVPRDRAAHTYGKSYRDVMRGLAGDFSAAPAAVAFPSSEDEVAAVLDWCGGAGLAAIPFGGGTSTVGGVEARDLGGRGAVSIDLGRMDRVLEIDHVSRAARIEAGILGPALEDALRPHGLTLRHYPQSFEFSTLGGWLATRSGGHYATLHTHIDDFVESLRVITPRGALATRRLPASGAGPAPEQLFLGSEGALGVITEAWMRVTERPRFRASATARFAAFRSAAEAARRIVQSGLHPSNCRLLDAGEALNNGIGDGTRHLLLVAFESHDHPLDPWMARALDLCRELGAELSEGAGRTRETGDRDASEGAWRRMFLRGPYLRDALCTLGLVVDTFETAVTWDRFEAFHARVMEETEAAARRVAGAAIVSSRITHVYPDGAAPYFTVIAPGKAGGHVAMWDEIKAAASEAVLSSGGTITHHHAVGRDHMPWYRRERPDLFGDALAAAKKALDPMGIMNPGVLV